MRTCQVVPVWEQLYDTVSVTSAAMFSAIPQKNRAAATTYFDEHLSHNDYYTQGEVLAHDQGGHWIGIGAEQLGLVPGDDWRTTHSAAIPQPSALLRFRLFASQVGVDSRGHDE
jgi:hypothetical protein